MGAPDHSVRGSFMCADDVEPAACTHKYLHK